MGKKTGIALAVIGVVLVVVAIVWWVALGPVLTKLPDDINSPMDFEGNLTYYVDPTSKQALPPGQEMILPLKVFRVFSSVSDLYTSDVAVCEDRVSSTVAGQERPAQITQYAFDRKTRKCVESDQNWAYSPNILLPDRVGHYGPLFSRGLEVGDTQPTFFSDVNKAFDLKVVEKIKDYNGLGITVLKVDAARPATEYHPAVAQALLGGQGLPMELTFDQFSAQLKAKGLDLEALLAALATVATPEDLQALQAMTQEPVKLTYKQESKDVVYIEAKTSATVGATFDRTTLMQVDTSGLMQAFTIVGKYAADPAIGAAIAPVLQAAGQLANAEPTKVYNQNMSVIKSSEASLAASAEKKISTLDWVELWVPLIVLIVGAILLLLVGYALLRARARKAA
ncbi:MAG: hypothetical protein JXA87_01845 [Thermoleophilia bacterium]|nr:hypothetical protein [Thermoleophilia bacterium]